MITQSKLDNIHNALIVGMAIEDAYIYAGLTPSEIDEITNNEDLQISYHKQIKQFEYGLLQSMKEIASKQARAGREQATVWMLEKMFPRYSNKPQESRQDIHLNISGTDPSSLDNVEIHIPEPSEED